MRLGTLPLIINIWEEDIKTRYKKKSLPLLDIRRKLEKGNFFDKKKIIIIKIEDKIYTAAITTSEKGTLISFI